MRELDPVTLAVLNGRLVQIADEMDATLFRSASRHAGAFQPLQPALLDIHRRLKQTFDPAGILNRGRMYPEF